MCYNDAWTDLDPFILAYLYHQWFSKAQNPFHSKLNLIYFSKFFCLEPFFSILIIRNSKKGINKSFEIMHSSWTFEIFNVLKLWSLLLFTIELIMVTGKDYRFNIESGYILIKHILWVKTVFCIIEIPESISTIRMSHWFPVIGSGYFR